MSNSVIPSSDISRVPLIPFSKYPDDSSTRAIIQELVNTALACPMLKKLAQKGCDEGDPLHGKKGPLEVIYDPTTCSRLRSLGFTDQTNRYIVLSTLDRIKALDILIFEIGNASQTKQYRTTQEQLTKKTTTCDEYAKGVEQIEHTSSILHHKIVQWGVNHLNWSTDLDTFKHCTEENFEREWHQKLRFSAHAQFYRKQYADITNMHETKRGYKEKIDSKLRLFLYTLQDLFRRISESFKRMLKKLTVIQQHQSLLTS